MKKIFLFAAMAFCLAAHADDNIWALKTQSGELVRLSDVSYIIEPEGETTFSIVKNNNTAVSGVTSARFVKTSATAIDNVSAGESGLTFSVSGNAITLIGTQAGATAGIYDLAGRAVKNVTTQRQQTVISLAGLVSGTYVLSLGKTNVKFIKK